MALSAAAVAAPLAGDSDPGVHRDLLGTVTVRRLPHPLAGRPDSPPYQGDFGGALTS